jgi:SAM-dependent MidA family methyltransferase
LPKAGIRGVIFSNELLDAMPRHRLRWDASSRVWFEWGVTVKGNGFDWIKMQDKATEQRNGQVLIERPNLPAELSAVLPDGFTTEVCPLAEHWWRQAASALHHGKLLTIDYGLTAEQFFMPERKGGTLRVYHRHRLNNDLLANAGEQDITAHVNFTALQLAGESVGLKTESWCSQAQFLTRIAKQIWNLNDAFGEWTPSHARQFQTLTHPEHLGRRFRVLLQSR